MNIEIKNIDTSKLDLGLRHDYIPAILGNDKADEKNQVVFDVEYFGVGERLGYTKLDNEGDAALDFRKIFLKKVKGIRGFVINGKPVTTSEAFLKYPGTPTMEALMNDVVIHIVKADELTEDEAKN